MLINIIIPTIFFVVLGIFFVGGFIIDPRNTLFTFTIYGFAAVLFYNLIIRYSVLTFILFGLLFSLLALVIFKPTVNIMMNIRNINWFILIGIMAYIISRLKKRGYYKDSIVKVIVSWFIGFIVVYVTMTVLNIYIYQFYQVDERIGLLFYLKQAIKLGSILGIGIGFGIIVAQSLNNSTGNNIKTV
ncbi:MAG: hypothetical protein KF816_17120 [Melioribacteraceae bacterium]|nr:hypothetical protein [Melioribacteraceae bacterium]